MHILMTHTVVKYVWISVLVHWLYHSAVDMIWMNRVQCMIFFNMKHFVCIIFVDILEKKTLTHWTEYILRRKYSYSWDKLHFFFRKKNLLTIKNKFWKSKLKYKTKSIWIFILDLLNYNFFHEWTFADAWKWFTHDSCACSTATWAAAHSISFHTIRVHYKRFWLRLTLARKSRIFKSARGDTGWFGIFRLIDWPTFLPGIEFTVCGSFVKLTWNATKTGGLISIASSDLTMNCVIVVLAIWTDGEWCWQMIRNWFLRFAWHVITAGLIRALVVRFFPSWNTFWSILWRDEALWRLKW